MRPFSKSPQKIEVTAADFLPDGKQLYMVVADADCNIHVLQFDPDSTCASLFPTSFPNPSLRSISTPSLPSPPLSFGCHFHIKHLFSL